MDVCEEAIGSSRVARALVCALRSLLLRNRFGQHNELLKYSSNRLIQFALLFKTQGPLHIHRWYCLLL